MSERSWTDHVHREVQEEYRKFEEEAERMRHEIEAAASLGDADRLREISEQAQHVTAIYERITATLEQLQERMRELCSLRDIPHLRVVGNLDDVLDPDILARYDNLCRDLVAYLRIEQRDTNAARMVRSVLLTVEVNALNHYRASLFEEHEVH